MSSKNKKSAQELLAQLSSVINELEKKHQITPKKAVHLVTKPPAQRIISFPTSIFNKKLASLESIVKYMKENLLLDYNTIARILRKNAGPIGVTYRRASKKMPEKLDVSSTHHIPFKKLADSKKSVLETIALHLKDCGFATTQISTILHRGEKTIYTVLLRARKKDQKQNA